MYSKRHLYDSGRRNCLLLLEEGFVKAFEDIFPLKEDLPPVMKCLKDAEKAERRGDMEECEKAKMMAADCLQTTQGYEWLAKYFYKTCYSVKEVKVHSLKQLGLLEERNGNLEEAILYLKKAMALREEEEDLRHHLRRIYHALGSRYPKKAFKCYTKTASLLQPSSSLQDKATSYGLLGKELMKLNRNQEALQNFETYITLNKECEDVSGICAGYFAVSEIYKRIGALDEMQQTLKKCHALASEHSLTLPIIFSSLSLGQLHTAKRNYDKACELFHSAYEMSCNQSSELSELCSVMYGMGRAHITFGKLASAIDSPEYRLLHWRKEGGPYSQ